MIEQGQFSIGFLYAFNRGIRFYSQNLVGVKTFDFIFRSNDCICADNYPIYNGHEEEDLHVSDAYFQDKFEGEESIAIFFLEFGDFIPKLSFFLEFRQCGDVAEGIE